MTDDRVWISRDDARILYDLTVGGLGFGSGFFDTEDTEACRRLAVALGKDPMDATPSEFASSYKHAPDGFTYQERRWVGLAGRGGDVSVDQLYEPVGEPFEKCRTCGSPVDSPVHWPTVEPDDED